jgi:hypothetical protein
VTWHGAGTAAVLRLWMSSSSARRGGMEVNAGLGAPAGGEAFDIPLRHVWIERSLPVGARLGRGACVLVGALDPDPWEEALGEDDVLLGALRTGETSGA